MANVGVLQSSFESENLGVTSGHVHPTKLEGLASIPGYSYAKNVHLADVLSLPLCSEKFSCIQIEAGKRISS